MKDALSTKAYAKVNLTLDVLSKRADGYHALRTLMHTVDVFDTVSADFARAPGVTATRPLPAGSAAQRAMALYTERTGCPGAHISIDFGIPWEAGLGSSSADAAAVLRLLDLRYHGLEKGALFALAAEVGADVPFLLEGGFALCEGKGELITPLERLSLTLVIAKGERGVSTRELFSRLTPPYEPGGTALFLEAAERGDASRVSNGLYPAALALAPEIGVLAERMLACGALGAAMTGSGSAVYGIFPGAAEAARAAAAFSDLPFARVCRTV